MNNQRRRKNFTSSDDALIRQQPVTGVGLKRLAAMLHTNQDLASPWSLGMRAMGPSTRECSALRMASSTRYFNDSRMYTGKRGYQNVPSITRVTAGDFGFLTLIQAFAGPDL